VTFWDLYRASRWLRPPQPPEPLLPDARFTRVKTEFSNTVFSGNPVQWEAYLRTPRADRYVRNVRISILWDGNTRFLLFRPETSEAVELARGLNAAYKAIETSARVKPFVGEVLDALLFENTTNGGTALNLYLSEALPGTATREVRFDEGRAPVESNIVVNAALAREFLANATDLLDADKLARFIGASWPLMEGILSKLARSSVPRDEFVERIVVSTQMFVLAINLLYKDSAKRSLTPNKAGECFERYHSGTAGVARARLHDRHPYFRLLGELRFFLSEAGYRNNMDTAQILVREYLDGRYLRLSLAGVMPDTSAAMAPMEWSWVKKHQVATPLPQLGRYGIQDADDLEAWRKVDGPFGEMGFSLIRQLGIGQFGRVYEAVNRENPHIPQLVALKVDRIQPGNKKRAIQAAELALNTARDLALSPHVIRIYDAGKLSGKKYTYHILQRVDGETLDHLAGVAGTEHASFHGPLSRGSHGGRSVSYDEALEASVGEAWRGARLATSFTDPLSLSQCLDLVTSMLLWVEEIHQIGYAINDLKNGNIMVSRRGQLKGIDLDSYEPATTPGQRTPDFVFLAVTLVILLLNVRRPGTAVPAPDDTRLSQDYEGLRAILNEQWAFGNIALTSGGRIQQSDVVDLFIELLRGCRDHSFAHDPERFSKFVDRFIRIKRLTLLDEMVLD